VPPSDILKGLSDERIKELMKETRINFRLTKAQKEEIEVVAREYGLSITNYLLSCHSMVASRHREKVLRELRRGK